MRARGGLESSEASGNVKSCVLFTVRAATFGVPFVEGAKDITSSCSVFSCCLSFINDAGVAGDIPAMSGFSCTIDGADLTCMSPGDALPADPGFGGGPIKGVESGSGETLSPLEISIPVGIVRPALCG